MTIQLDDPAELYRLVEVYSDFGDHLTGSHADRRTADWLADLLDQLGAEAALEPFRFDQFDCSAELTLTDGHPTSEPVVVPSVPVYYSATGLHRTNELSLERVPAADMGDAGRLDPLLDRAAAEGVGGLIVATDGPIDEPVQANRWPTVRGPVPAVIVAENSSDRLAAAIDPGRLELGFEAATSPSEGWNVLGQLGPTDARRVIITTPLTGWFRCASERGTGIAAALALTQALAADHRVEFVGCGGHELHFRGLEHHLDLRSAEGATVIQLGASVGATVPTPDGPGELDPGRMVLTTITGEQRSAISGTVTRGNWSTADLGDRPWPGESGVWQRAGADVLAFLGHSHYFHTSADLPQLATSADALALATSVIIETAGHYLQNGDRS